MPITIDTFYAEAIDYDTLHVALCRRVEQMDVSRESIDYVSGLQHGYVSKLLAPAQVKGMGRLSSRLLLRALGLKLIVVDDPDAVASISQRYESRKKCKAHRQGTIRKIA
jgi:hypothetical protein